MKHIHNIILFTHFSLFPNGLIDLVDLLTPKGSHFKIRNLRRRNLKPIFLRNYGFRLSWNLNLKRFSDVFRGYRKRPWYGMFSGVKHVSWGFNTHHLTPGNKRVLGLHIWNQLPETLKAASPFKPFKWLLNNWFGPKCKLKVSSYLDN